MRKNAVRRRLAASLVAAALALATHALAASPPPPPPRPVAPSPITSAHDTTAIGYIEHVVIGRAACDTCPPRVCPGEPVLVTISGATESPCVQFRGFRELAVGAPFTVLEAEFFADTCGVPCPTVMVPFSAAVSLPTPFSTSSMFQLRHVVRSCPDSNVIASVQERVYTYEIEPNCFEPPPVDSLVKTFVTFNVEPPRRCPGDTLTLEMKKRGCHPCVHLSSFAYDSAMGYTADVTWRPLCAELVCNPESLHVSLGAFQAGFHLVNVNVNVHVLDTPNPDSVISFVQPVRFDVPICQDAPCVDGWMPPHGSEVDTACTTIKRPGELGTIVLPARTGVAVWGAQGSVVEGPGLRVRAIEYAGGAPGTYVTWNRAAPSRVAWIVFTTGDQPILRTGLSTFLRVHYEVAQDAHPMFSGFQGFFEQAAGKHAEGLEICPEIGRQRPTIVPVCIEAGADTCDANGDGRADVRDLITMVNCFRLEDLPIGGSRVCQDCNQDSTFNIADILCCARHILRAPNLPTDSSTWSSDVRVAFGEFVRAGDNWIVPVRVTGAEGLAGTLLRLRYPGDRWRAHTPVYTTDGGVTAPSGGGWMPLADTGVPGEANIGWLKIGEGSESELSFTLIMESTGTAQPGDELVVEGADLVRPDGRSLRPTAALPRASLLDGAIPPPETVSSKIALGPALPNPFTSTTRFAVSLPRESMIELTIHDVAGRVVATLARGRFAAGVKDFAWNGAGARSGVYFARLSVDGQVYSQRVAMVRGGQ